MRTKEKRKIAAVPSGDAPASDMKKKVKGKRRTRRMIKENEVDIELPASQKTTKKGKAKKGKLEEVEDAEITDDTKKSKGKKSKLEEAEDVEDGKKTKGNKSKTEEGEDVEDGKKPKGKKAKEVKVMTKETGEIDILKPEVQEVEPDAKSVKIEKEPVDSMAASTARATLGSASRSSSHVLSSEFAPCHPSCPHIPPCCLKDRAQYMRNELERRIMQRKMRFLQRWPQIELPKIRTKPWSPPGPPKRPPPIEIKIPKVRTQEWVPPYALPRPPRPRRPHIPPAEMNKPYEGIKLKRIWHNFTLIDKDKMILQGKAACNSKKHSNRSGAQTACIAVMCRALIEEKPESELAPRDIDDAIATGGKYYKQCLLNMKCYKGKPQLELNQLLTTFYFRDAKYTIKIGEGVKAPLVKRPVDVDPTPDLVGLLEQRQGSKFASILSAGARHFLVWSAGEGRVCYIFDPHILNEVGLPYKPAAEGALDACGGARGAGAVLRYANAEALVSDFAAHYGNLEPACPVPQITLTDITVEQREPLLRHPPYMLDLKVLHTHCPSEWTTLHRNVLIEEKRKGKYPTASLSAVSLATSRGTAAKRVQQFLMKEPEHVDMPMPPVPSERLTRMPEPAPARGEGSFFYTPIAAGAHAYGRDDMLPLPKSETKLHSVVDVANKNFHSQYQQLDAERWILRGTRHMASKRYYAFKWYTGIACCVCALGMLRRLRARAWNEDTVDETLDAGWSFYRESLGERRGPVRRLVLGEHKDSFVIRDKEYQHKEVNVAVWGKMVSTNPKVFDLCRGIEEFFKTNDAGILQIPGELETAIWNEGGMYYLYHPWPADRNGYRVSLQGGGKACLLSFSRVTGLCDHFLEGARAFRRKPYSISAVSAWERPPMPEPVNQLKPVAPNRWVVRGSFHEGDVRFPEEHRNKQATPTSIAAIAYAHVVPPNEWTREDVNESVIKGDILYESTMEHLEKMGISLDKPEPAEEDQEAAEPEPEQEGQENYSGMLAAGEVVDRFRITDEDCIFTEVLDGAFVGSLNPTEPGVMSLKESLKELFRDHTHAVLTAQGRSMAVWKADNSFYMFDPHGCDENGYPSDDPLATACLVRLGGSVAELARAVESNLPAGPDDSFSLSPVAALRTKLEPALGAPQPALESKAFEWIKKGTAAIMPGPRGENSAVGKVAGTKAGIGDEDKAGRTLALPAVAAFAAAADAVPPPHMHQDHMYNFLDAGADYYREHMKKTGRKDIGVDDLTERFELGANTFSIELEEAHTRLPLRLPDVEPITEGAGAEALGEVESVHGYKEMKELLTAMWRDETKPTQTMLLVGDYHQLGVWMAAGGQLVVFDPAPTLHRGMLTEHRIAKGDELRLKRIADETVAGEDVEMAADEAGGEEVPEPEPVATPVPPEATPALMVFASPAEFIDKLVQQAPLNNQQMIAPYKLYTVKVTNELTSTLRDQRPLPKQPRAAETEEGDEEKEIVAEEVPLVEALDEQAVGKYMKRAGRAVASVRGRIAQHENYFLEPQRDYQDAAISVMAIIVDNIEPYIYWRPELIDSIVMYGDRLYTISVAHARSRPRVSAAECARNMHLTSFNVKLETETDVVTGDMRAQNTGDLLDLPRGITEFLQQHQYGVLCSKNYCCALWRGFDNKAICVFDPHCVGPAGRASPTGGAGLVVYSCADEAAAAFKHNVDQLGRPGNGKFYITAVNVQWEYSTHPGEVPPKRSTNAIPDEGYEHKVLTAYSEFARERTILRGSRPYDPAKFVCDAVLQSAAGAVAGACMAHVRKPHLWTRNTVDQVMSVSNQLFTASVASLGYEFRPGEDLLLPLQVLKRFQLGTTYVRYELDEVYTGRLEPRKPDDLILTSALERFFESNTHGILWVAPHAVAVWKTPTAPRYYMFEPHACGPTGLRIDGQENGAACVITFSSPSLMAYSYLQNHPPNDRKRRIFHLYTMSVTVAPIKRLEGGDPPLVRAPPGAKLVPATSKVGVDGQPRRADEKTRRHPPGGRTCTDALSALEARDQADDNLAGRRNANGWLVLRDGSQYLSARHSMACRKFSRASRGNQALACCVMAVAMSRVQDVCRWCPSTLDAVLLSGDQLYQDSYLHYRPEGKQLAIDQILRKFYAPGNCVCRVVVYRPRQKGKVHKDLVEKLTEFFREEKCGVFEADDVPFAVALFRTPRGFYMFDPADRDRYGRAVPPPCVGHARACFSQFPTVQALANKLAPNIPAPEDEWESPRLSMATPEPSKGSRSVEGAKSSIRLASSTARPESTTTERQSQSKTPPGSRDLVEIKKSDSVQRKLSPALVETIESKNTSEKLSTAEPEVKSIDTKEKSMEKGSPEKLASIKTAEEKQASSVKNVEPEKEVRYPEIKFRIYGMEVTGLRRLNQHEK